MPKLGIPVVRGMTHDGLGKYLSQIIKKAPGSTVDIVKLLKDTKTDVVVNYLPVGSRRDGAQLTGVRIGQLEDPLPAQRAA